MKEKILVGVLDNIDSNFNGYKLCDLIIFGTNCFDTFCYKREITVGENYQKMVSISKNFDCPILIPLKTDSYGKIRRSIAIFNGGKLLSIADCNHIKEGEEPAFGYKVVRSSLGKLGIMVGSDILDCDGIKSLSICGAELIINLYADIYDFSMVSLISSLSYLYGLPIISCGGHGIIFSSSQGVVEFKGNVNAKSYLNTTKTIKLIQKKSLANF